MSLIPLIHLLLNIFQSVLNSLYFTIDFYLKNCAVHLFQRGLYRVEDSDENYTHSAHFLWTFKHPMHSDIKMNIKKKIWVHSKHFIVVAVICLPFCVHIWSHTPLSTWIFGRAGYATFSSSCPTPDLYTILLQPFEFCTESTF